MSENHVKDVLGQIARRAVPDDKNLMPQITVRLERKSLMGTLRAHPVLTILLALLALVLLSGVAYAIGKVTGYIPGVGLVDQSVPLRTLAEPVSVTRNGVTLTVEQVVLSADKTILVYKVEGIPADAYPRGEIDEGGSSYSSSSSVNLEGTPEVSHSIVENVVQCSSDNLLLLTDGSTVPTRGGDRSGWESGFESRFEYDAIPANVNEAMFLISCIDGTELGKLPENWEILLHFVLAPPDMRVLPVVDIDTPETIKSQSAMILENVIETDNGYIVIGKFQSTALPLNAKAQGISDWITVMDANGQFVEARPPESMNLVSTVYGEFYWAYEIQGKQQAFPLTFTLNAVSADIPEATVEFRFDTGPDSKVGQVWKPNEELEIAGYTIKIVSIERLEKGYSFIFKSDPDVISISAEINQVPFSSASGGSDGFGNGNLFYIVEYDGEIPSGNLAIRLNWLRVNIHGPWQVQWSPETPETSLYGISLHVDQFIPLDDGYYLIGHAEWTDDRIASVASGGWAFKAFDSAGREVPIEPAIFDDDLVSQGLQPGQWAYHLYGKNFNGPLTLQATQMGVEFTHPIMFTLNLSSNGFDFSDQNLGMKWEINQPLDVPGIMASVSTAMYVKEGDLYGFQFDIDADPALQGIGFGFESGLITDDMYSVAGGGGSNRDETSGSVRSKVMTNAPMQFPLVLKTTGTSINGVWKTTWNPPVDNSGSSPVFVQQACLDLPRWKQISAKPLLQLPAELAGMSSGDGTIPPDDITITSPDKRWLAFTSKVKGRLGSGLYISKLNGSESHLLVQLDYWMVLNNLVWSPDSKWIGFGILNTDLPEQGKFPFAAINIDTCDVFPIANNE